MQATVRSAHTFVVVLDYNAPLQVYDKLNTVLARQPVIDCQVCVGKEWYRYPSSFFLPGDW